MHGVISPSALPPTASAVVTWGLALLSVVVALLFIAGGARVLRAGARWPAVGSALWLGLTFALARSGWLARFDLRPPPLALLFLVTGVLGLTLGFSRLGQRYAMGLPVWMLIAAQSFRLPLELVMHRAAQEGVMPVQMSLGGWNFDIISGTLAIPLAWLAARGRAPRWLLLGWSVLGSVLLLAIIAIAVVSTPMIHAFGESPALLNTWVAHAPFVWLPAVLVLAAIFGHIVILRRLVADFRGPRSSLA